MAKWTMILLKTGHTTSLNVFQRGLTGLECIYKHLQAVIHSQNGSLWVST